MKRLFSSFLLICLLNINANAQAVPKISTDSALLAGDWWLLPVLPSDTATGHLPKINFDLAKQRFSGFTGCNQMSGSFRVAANGITFDKNMTLTRMACEGYNEKDFIANLLRITRYELKNGVLVFSIEKTPISKWVRKTTVETVAATLKY
jgi:heat shock protein HslJ